MKDTCAIALVFNLTLVFMTSSASAQSFFATLFTDPTVGVDRGSASQIVATDELAKFVTFDTYGPEEVGPITLGFGLAAPRVFTDTDQLDFVVALAGMSEDNELELRAAGFGYRADLGDNGTSLFIQSETAKFRPGNATNLAFGVSGEQSSLGVGVKRVFELADDAKFTATGEFVSKHVTGEFLGATAVNEDLRLLRASAIYQQGIPMLFQRRFAVSMTKGLTALGASAEDNPLASSPGATSKFFRASFAGEVSIPLSQEFVVNAGVFGQWSEDSLPSSQRCGYGTNAYARGFDQSFVNGDRCLGGRFELAYNVEFPEQNAPKIVFTQAFAGLDSGTIIDNENALLPAVEDEWTSFSVGLRSLRGNFLGEIVVTHILDAPAGVTSQDETRIWLRAGKKF